jgi:6-phosphofructokinase 1
VEKTTQNDPACAFIGLMEGSIKFFNMEDFLRMVDLEHQRPKQQWWMDLRPIVRLLAQPCPSWQEV